MLINACIPITPSTIHPQYGRREVAPNGWTAWRSLNIRPEIRYDVYDGSGHLFAPVPGAAPGSAVATKDRQLIGILNAVKKF